MQETVKVSQHIPPHDADRFQVSVGSTGAEDDAALFLINLVLIYNETSVKLETETMLLLVYPPWGGLNLAFPPYLFEGYPDEVIPGSRDCMEHNVAEAELILESPAERYKAINDLENLISEAKTKLNSSK